MTAVRLMDHTTPSMLAGRLEVEVGGWFGTGALHMPICCPRITYWRQDFCCSTAANKSHVLTLIHLCAPAFFVVVQCAAMLMEPMLLAM